MMASPSNPRCLITGCDLVQDDRIVHGDLHEVGDCYVFNACRNDKGEAAWHDLPLQLPPHTKAVIVGSETSYFERHGVFTFHKAKAFLNNEALEYLKPN